METPIRRPRYMPALYVAAAVSLVVAGIMLFVVKPLPRPQGSPPARDEIAVTRCANAIDRSGKSALFPSANTWRPTLFSDSASDEDRTVLGVAHDGQTFFCEVTETTVTVSDPTAPRNYAAGSRTALLLLTKNGVAAGVADSSWPAVSIYTESSSARQVPTEDMFVHEIGVYQPPIMVKRADADYSQAPSSTDFTGGAELPPPPPPALTFVDRPRPPGDRASDLGKKLGACLANSDQPVLAPDTYSPGAHIGDLIIARSSTKIGVCTAGAQAAFRSGFRLSMASDSAPMAFYSGHVNGRPVLAGAIPSGTARMAIRFPNGATVYPVIANGTFAVVIPSQVELAAGDTLKDEDLTSAWVYGTNGRVTYGGSLQFWRPPTR